MARTELIWDGEYLDEARAQRTPVFRAALPFQTVETVNESSAERRSLFSALERDKPWRDLIWGDKKFIMPSLLPEFAGQVNLIDIDPPFDSGADFSFTATIPEASHGAGPRGLRLRPYHGDQPRGSLVFTKQPSIVEQKAYRDTWGRGLDSYLQWPHPAWTAA